MRWNLPLILAACMAMSCARSAHDPGAAATREPAPAPQAAAAVAQALFDAVTAAPEDPAARRVLAIALHNAGRREEALPHFEQLVQLAPEARHLMDLALAYASMSRTREAEATYQRLLALTPDQPIALHNLGNLAMGRGDAQGAVELYRKALALQPGYLMARGHMGDALKQLGRHEEAYRAYESVLELEPTTVPELSAFDDALYGMALLDLEMGATQRAAEMLAELVQSAPEHPSAHYAYSRALTALGRLDEARKEMEAHVQLQARRGQPAAAVAAGDSP